VVLDRSLAGCGGRGAQTLNYLEGLRAASFSTSDQLFKSLFGVLASTSMMDSFTMRRTALLVAVLLDLLRGFSFMISDHASR